MKRRTIFKSLAAGVVAGLLASSALNAGGISVPPYFTLGSTLVALGRTVTSIAGLTLSGPSITGITGAIKAGSPASQAACADLSNAAASCATDATNATNITSGTLPAARLNGQIGSAGYYANQLLFVSALPGMIAPTGTMANNGAVTLGTALSANSYANLYLHFPANAIVAGSAAGWYFAQCSTTVACTVFNNVYTSGQPTIPVSPTPFVTTGPGAYTGETIEVAYPVFALPAGTLGPRDAFKMETLFSRSGTTNTSVLKHAANGPGGTAFFSSNQATAANKSQAVTSWVANRESQATQVSCSGSGSAGGCSGVSTAATVPTTSVNFANQNTIGPTVTNGAATDFVGVEYFALTLLKSQ